MANRLFVRGNEFPFVGVNRILIFNFLSSVIKNLGINISLFFYAFYKYILFQQDEFFILHKIPGFQLI